MINWQDVQEHVAFFKSHPHMFWTDDERYAYGILEQVLELVDWEEDD